MKAIILGCCLAIIGGGAARADIPVDDAAQLTRKTQTASHTNDMVPVQQNHDKGQKGINCATHTGQKGTTQNNTARPDAEAGAAAVKKYDAQMPATPAADAKGPALAYQMYGKSAGDVVAGNIATQTTIASNGPTYRAASSANGQAPTIMAGYDQNSSLGAQNGLSWNQVMATANLLVSAYNAANLARVSQVSQAARAMNFVPWAFGAGAVPNSSLCGAGYRGSATAGDPCVALDSAVCQSLSDGGCWERRYVDAAGNVVVYLERAQAQSAIQ